MRCQTCREEVVDSKVIDAIAEGAPRICHTCLEKAESFARDHLQAWRRAFGVEPPDEAWFTDAWGSVQARCGWAEYWEAVRELWEIEAEFRAEAAQDPRHELDAWRRWEREVD